MAQQPPSSQSGSDGTTLTWGSPVAHTADDAQQQIADVVRGHNKVDQAIALFRRAQGLLAVAPVDLPPADDDESSDENSEADDPTRGVRYKEVALDRTEDRVFP
jgi:hypothetical protein